MEQLEAWSASAHSHSKVRVIYKYLKNKSLVADLVSKSILHLDDNAQLIDDWKSKDVEAPTIFKQLSKKDNKYDQGSALVRWRVEVSGDLESATWKDSTVYDSWRDFYLSKESRKKLCHITGEIVATANNHPRRIRSSGDGAKIISVPVDQTFFTYKGRFVEADEACSVGVETTQKAHNALRRSIAQGYL